MRILAIDPGYDRMGIAVVEGDPSRPTVVWSDCVLPPKGNKEDRLAFVSAAIKNAIDEHTPEVFALESLFFSVNKKTALGVAEARGAALSAAGEAGLIVREFSPGTVKLAVTGSGRADKKAIASMVPKLVALTPRKRLDDELDAIAVGITALAHRYPQQP
ncbi:MAG: crossover junction endodeoxyribonuclease RuvC [Parcubacteria bacterium C7867-001]|nr:MAG: crossover junction endodeoxyribonuclease RuvC [Parcubacteria bacterium C7867-001]